MVSANVTFSLCAAAGSLAVAAASAVKGRWAVAIIFALLVIGFLARALEGRRSARREVPPPGPPPARRVKPARFKRR